MSLLKAKLKHLSSLKQKKIRQIENKFIIEGEKILSECIDSNWTISEAFFSEEAMSRNKILKQKLESKKIPITITASKDFEKFSNDKTPSQVAALVERKQVEIDKIFSLPVKRLLILQDISDPGNLGTIIRSADWFGVNGIICDESTVELTNPKVIKGSMGSIFHLPIVENVELTTFCKTLQTKGIKIFSTSTDGNEISKISFPENCAIVFGNESSGVSDQLHKLANDIIAIPKLGNAESLNVSIAASIILYEWARKAY